MPASFRHSGGQPSRPAVPEVAAAALAAAAQDVAAAVVVAAAAEGVEEDNYEPVASKLSRTVARRERRANLLTRTRLVRSAQTHLPMAHHRTLQSALHALLSGILRRRRIELLAMARRPWPVRGSAR